jgi:Uma2 family endonuclease
MPHHAARRSRPPRLDPFRYGWRFVKKLRRDGTTDLVQVPLTLEDVLHPQEGDVIPESTLPEQDAEYLRPIFRQRAARLPRGFFLADCLVDWGVPPVRPHSPDLVVFRDVTPPARENFGLFRLHASGGHCVLALEIVSPNTRSNDVVHKLREYHQVGVPLYYLIDQEDEDGPRWVVGYRHTKARYVKMRPDRQGRLLIKPLGLWLGVEENHAVCYDADTGERLGDYRAEVEGRRAAEERAHEEAGARRAAEERLREEADARQTAEEQLRALEAELRRLRGGSATD